MAAPISALSAARHMCERSGWGLTNLELQKMLYLAQMMFMGKNNGQRLMTGSFEAWDYGPVSPQVYREVKAFGREPIRSLWFSSKIQDPARIALLDEAVDELSKLRPAQLVNITHWKDGAWARNYVPNQRGIVIPDEHIIDEYRRRFPND